MAPRRITAKATIARLPAREIAPDGAMNVLRFILRQTGPITITASEMKQPPDADSKVLVTEAEGSAPVTFEFRAPIAKSIDVDDSTEVINILRGGRVVHRVVIGAPPTPDRARSDESPGPKGPMTL